MTTTEFAQLGIGGLPARTGSLARGMMYAIVADQQSLRIPLLARTAVRSLELGIPCILLAQADPAAWVKKARLAGIELGTYVRSGALRIFRHEADAGKAVFRAGAAQVIGELEQGKIEAGSLLLFDQADSFFQLADPRFAATACQEYQSWIEESQLTLVATFVPSSHAPRDYVTLRAIAENMAGFAVMRNGVNDTQLEFRHWFGSQGPNPRTCFTLNFDDNGQLNAWAAGRGASAAVDPVMELEVATRKAMEDFSSTAAHGWRAVDTYADALTAVRDNPAGTIVLHFSFGSEFKMLCQTVVSMRALGKPQWRIVVRETGARLRIPHVVALMRLGASLVVPESMGSTQSRLVCEAFRGTLFTRGVEPRVDSVIEDLRGLESRSLTSPKEFRLAAEKLMASGTEFDIPHTLVRLSLDQIEGERISSLLARRGARDLLVTEFDQSLWLFMFACPIESAEPVLVRLLGKNFERLFQGWFRVGKNREILTALEQLEDEVKKAEVPPQTNVINLRTKRSA
jgi:Cellulose biosynthesis GIL